MAIGIFSSSGGNTSDQSVDTQRRFQLLQSEAPELDPTTMWNLASTSIPDAELVNNAVKAIGIGTMRLSVDNLKSKTRDAQASTWAQMSTGRQQLFLDNGYVPPESAHHEDPMWTAPFRAVGWLWDKTKVGPAVVSGVGAVAGAAQNFADDFASRPYRMQADIAGQNQDARVDLMLNDARAQMEKNGVQLTDQEWQYLKWKYEEDNPRTREYLGTGGSDIGRAQIFQLGGQATGLSAGVNAGEAIWGGVLDKIPLLGPALRSISKNVKTDNMYTDHGQHVDDALYQQFTDAVSISKAKKENDLGPVASWNRVDNGDSYIQPVDLRKAQEKLGGKDTEGYDLAAYMAQNHTMDDYLSKVENLTPNTTEYAARAKEISTNFLANDNFKSVLSDLTKSSSKVSIGRDYAETLHLGEDSPAFTLVSGGVDAAHVMLMDPILAAGHAVKIGRVIQYGIDVADIPAVSHAYAVYNAAKTGVETAATAVISGENNIKYMANVHTALNRGNAGWARDIFEKHGVPTMEALFDETGKPTDFLIDNYVNLRSALREATASISNTIGKGGLEFGVEATTPREIAAQKSFSEHWYRLANDLEQMSWGVARANEYAGLREVGPVASYVRNRVMQNQFRFMDRVMQAVEEAHAATNVEDAAAAWKRLQQDIPRGVAWVNTLIPLDEKLAAKGFGGIRDASDIYAHLSGEGLLGLQNGKLSGLAVTGFGNGMQIPDSWRLIASHTEDVPVFRNRGELVRLPTLSNGEQITRKVLTTIGNASDRLLDMGVQDARLFTRVVSAPARVPTMFVKSLLTRVPRVPIMSLTGEDGLARFKELVDQGAFFGMPTAVRDEWMGKMLVNTPDYMNAPVHFSGVGAELPHVIDTLRGETAALTRFPGTRELLDKGYDEAAARFHDVFGQPLSALVDEQGHATPFFQEHFADIQNWAHDVASKSYVGGEVVAPHLTEENPVFQTLARFQQVPTMSSLTGQRIAVQRGFIKELFTYMGMYKTEAGRQAAEDMLRSIDNVYSTTAPMLQTGSEQMNVGLYPVAQHSSQMMMPDFQNLIQLQKQIGAMRKVSFSRIMGLYNHRYVDAFMTKYWRPTALLRGGFVPAVGGDEYLAFLSRRGMMTPLSNLATASTRDSRGPITGLMSAITRAPAKAWGQIYKQGMADEIWRISNSMGAENLSSYMESMAQRYLDEGDRAWIASKNLHPAEEVLRDAQAAHAEQQALMQYGVGDVDALHAAEAEVERAGNLVLAAQAERRPLFSAFDHMALAADFYTAKAMRAIRRIEFSALPPSLQEAVLTMAPATDRVALVEAAGLNSKFDLARAVGSANQAMMRGEFYKKIIHEHLSDVGKSNYIEENIAGQVPAREITMKNSAYSGERMTLKVNDNGHWATFDTAEHNLDESAPQRAVKYHLLSNDPIARTALNDGLRGKIAEPELQTFLDAQRHQYIGHVPVPDVAATVEEKLAAAQAFQQRMSGYYSEDMRRLLQEERALANTSRPFVSLTEQDRQILPGELRDAVDVAPEGSLLEQVLQRVLHPDVRDSLFGSTVGDSQEMNQRLADVLTLHRLQQRNRGMAHLLLADGVPIKLLNIEEDAKLVADAAFRELQNPHYAGYVYANPRATYHEGVRVINPPMAGTRSLYSVMIDRATADHISSVLSHEGGHAMLLNEITRRGASQDDISLLRQMLQQWHTRGVDDLIAAKDALSNGVMVPFSTAALTNYDDAQRLSALLDAWSPTTQLPDGSLSPLLTSGKTVGAGYLEVPRTNDFGYIPHADRARIVNLHPEDRMIPLDDITLDKFRVFGDRSMRRYDEFGNLAADGTHVREGALHTDALRGWADEISRDLMQMHTAPSGVYLHEIIEPMLTGRMDVNAIRQVAFNRLPSQYIAPELYAMTPENAWAKLVKFGWDRVINPMIAGAVRHPMFTLSFADGMQGAEAVAEAMRNPVLEREFAKLPQLFADDMSDLQFRNYMQNLWHNIHPDVRNTINTAEDFENELRVLYRRELLSREEVETFGRRFNPQQKETLINWTKHNANIDQMKIKVAGERALNDVIPFIHDHHIRSVFQEYARNIMPFEFAQEQFLRRWVNTVRYSPEALRRMQLIEHGFSASVFSQKDPETGEAMIAIPASAALQGLLTNNFVTRALYGKGVSVPVSTPLSMAVKNVLPDLGHEFSHLPSLGPLATVSAYGVISHFPEMLGGSTTARQMFSPLAGDFPVDTQRNVLEQFVPPMYVKMASGIFGDFGRSVGDVNATSIAAIQQMEAEAIRIRAEIATIDNTEQNRGTIEKLTDKVNMLSLPDNATSEQIDKYLDNVKIWARANLFTRGLVGFMMPTSTIKANFKDAKLAPEFGKLMENMSFEEAMGVFLSEHPNATPFTVFASSKSTKAPLAPTQEALKWMDDNGQLLSTFQLAGPWLMPQGQTTSDFSAQAYADMVGMGLRNRDDLKQWYRNYKYSAGANLYFPMKERYDQMLADAEQPEEKKRLTLEWKLKSDQLKAQFPIFSEELAKSGNDLAERTLDELSLALSNPDLPDPGHLGATRELVNRYQKYVYEHQLLSTDNSKLGRQKTATAVHNFLQWGTSFIEQYPTLRSMWNSLILPSTNLRTKDAINRANGDY